MKKFICLIALLLAPAITTAGDWGDTSMENSRRMQQEQASRDLERHFEQMIRQQEREQQQQMEQMQRNQERMERQMRARDAEVEHRRYMRTFGGF